MMRKVKKYICCMIACVTCIAVAMLYSVNVLAASFNENVEDAEWRYFVGGCKTDTTKNTGLVSVVDTPVPEGCPTAYPELVNGKKYTEHFTYTDCNDNYFGTRNCTISSDSEIICMLVYNNTQEDIDCYNEHIKQGYKSGEQIGGWYVSFFSKSDIYMKVDGYWFNTSKVWDTNSNYSREEYKCVIGDTYTGYSSVGITLSFSYAEGQLYRFKTGKMKVFTTAKDCFNYLDYGIEDGLAWQGASPKYDGEAYLENFQMIVHDSNAYSAYYIEFKYTIPDKLKDCSSLYLDIDESFEWTVCGLSSLVTYPRTYNGVNRIDLLQNFQGFKLYLDDIDAIHKFCTDIPIASTVSRRAVLGSELGVDFSDVSIDGFGGDTVAKISNSKLYLTCYVVADERYGQSVNGTIDFMSGNNSIASYTPDSSGSYSYNGDYKANGHYYDLVGTDAAGNASHSYYYYSTDNSKTEVSANDYSNNTFSPDIGIGGGSGSAITNIVTVPDHIFVTLSGSADSSDKQPDVTIEDDDLSFDSLRESIRDGCGLIDDIDTGAKGDGLIAMMSDLFAYLPASFVGLIMLGTSSVVGIAILRMIFKR